jgi:hypothetical protein
MLARQRGLFEGVEIGDEIVDLRWGSNAGERHAIARHYRACGLVT